jgi:hypothetical protein
LALASFTPGVRQAMTDIVHFVCQYCSQVGIADPPFHCQSQKNATVADMYNSCFLSSFSRCSYKEDSQSLNLTWMSSQV